jgi:hypothetical protein
MCAFWWRVWLFLAMVSLVAAVVGGMVWLCVENCIVDASIFVVKCVRADVWMPWHQEPMKDVGGRDRPGGVVNRAVIPGCPNGVTRHQLCGVTRA